MSRIVVLVTGLEPGGAEMQAVALARSLKGRGWELTVLALSPGPLESELREANVPVHVLGLFALLVRLARLKPAIVHAHLFHANVAARLARLLCPIPVVISTVHSIAESSRRSDVIRWRDLLYRATDALSDATVFVCSAAADRHISTSAMRRACARVIPNGVDTTRFRPDAALRIRMRTELGLGEEFAWLAAGRLMWKKNYPLLLEAMTRLHGGVLLVCGTGPDASRLHQLAGANVRFLGARADMPALMNACDGFVLSSDAEGLPMVLLEAAATGLPQVATAVGGVPEAVIHERTGYLVPKGDAAALAEAMQRLCTLTAEERASMGRTAREHAVSCFDLPVVTARWEDLYRHLLETARTAEMEP